MHLCDFKPHTQKTLQIGLGALAKLNDFRHARPAASTDIGPIANPSIIAIAFICEPNLILSFA